MGSGSAGSRAGIDAAPAPGGHIVLRLAEVIARRGEGGIDADLQATMAERQDPAQCSAIGWIAVTISACVRIAVLSALLDRQTPR